MLRMEYHSYIRNNVQLVKPKSPTPRFEYRAEIWDPVFRKTRFNDNMTERKLLLL